MAQEPAITTIELQRQMRDMASRLQSTSPAFSRIQTIQTLMSRLQLLPDDEFDAIRETLESLVDRWLRRQDESDKRDRTTLNREVEERINSRRQTPQT